MEVDNMRNARGQKVPNQFIITNAESAIFQSYGKVIAQRFWNGVTLLDRTYWDYSRTTGRYRNLFLGESKKETLRKIKNGTYKLEDLN